MLVFLALVAFAFDSQAVPLPTEDAAGIVELAEVHETAQEAPVDLMLKAIDSQVHHEERSARKKVDAEAGMKSLDRTVDEAINKAVKQRDAASDEMPDVGAAIGEDSTQREVQKVEAKAEAQAKMQAALRSAKRALSKIPADLNPKHGSASANVRKQSAMADVTAMDSLSDMQSQIRDVIKAGMAHIQKPVSPLDAAINKIAAVRAKEKAKQAIKDQLQSAQHSVDLAESDEDLPLGAESFLQEVGGDELEDAQDDDAAPPGPASSMPPPQKASGPPNPPITEAKKTIPKQRPIASVTKPAPRGNATLLNQALAGAKPDHSNVAVRKHGDPAADVQKSVSKDPALTAEVSAIQSYKMSEADAKAEGGRKFVSWSQRNKKKGGYESGPNAKSKSAFGSGSGSGSSSGAPKQELGRMQKYLKRFKRKH